MLFTVRLAAIGGITLGLVLGAGFTGCGSDDHPPPLGSDPVGNTPSHPDGGVYFEDLGPDLPPGALGECGATVVELEVVRPNLYFLVDSSGSMTEAMPGLVLQNRFDAARIAIELVLRDVGHRVNFGASVFPANAESCGPGREIHETARGDPVSYAVADESGPQLKSLAFELLKIAPNGTTPTATALTALHDTLTALPGKTFLFLMTDGAPNCNLDLNCNVDQCTANIERVRYLDNAVCDDSINCCSDEIFGPGTCLDSAATLDAVAALHEDGVNTFVIGMPGTETYGALLDDLAHAGGLARSEAPYYYPVTDSEGLVETLRILGGSASLSCHIDLNDVPPDPALVNVFLDDTLVPFDPLDGWTWGDDTAPSEDGGAADGGPVDGGPVRSTPVATVELHGEPCDLATDGQVLQIQVVAGCPVVLR
jgi:hypothetical protein